jgi:hypothetical protein
LTILITIAAMAALDLAFTAWLTAGGADGD